MNTPISPENNPFPDNATEDGSFASWNGESPDGWEGRFGVLQEGFDATFPVPDWATGGERIWLYEPDGKQELRLLVLDSSDEVVDTHILSGAGSSVTVAPGYQIHASTPEGQGQLTYLCDYPGVYPEKPETDSAAQRWDEAFRRVGSVAEKLVRPSTSKRGVAAAFDDVLRSLRRAPAVEIYETEYETPGDAGQVRYHIHPIDERGNPAPDDRGITLDTLALLFDDAGIARASDPVHIAEILGKPLYDSVTNPENPELIDPNFEP